MIVDLLEGLIVEQQRQVVRLIGILYGQPGLRTRLVEDELSQYHALLLRWDEWREQLHDSQQKLRQLKDGEEYVHRAIALLERDADQLRGLTDSLGALVHNALERPTACSGGEPEEA
jgi:hypothetical protein